MSTTDLKHALIARACTPELAEDICAKLNRLAELEDWLKGADEPTPVGEVVPDFTAGFPWKRINYYSGQRLSELDHGTKLYVRPPVPNTTLPDAERFVWLYEHSDACWEVDPYSKYGHVFVVRIPVEHDEYGKVPVDFRIAIDRARLRAERGDK